MEDNLEAVRIKKIGVISLANICALIMAAFGFVIGLGFTTVSFMFDSAAIFGTDILSGWLAYSSFLILTIVYGLMGFIFGAFGALLYNVFAKITNGIKLYA